MDFETWLKRCINMRCNVQHASCQRTRAPQADQLDQLDPETEVEVLVMAYHSFVQGCCERSLTTLLSFLHSRAELYVNRGHFHLLVRLLVAVPEYHALEYMFGLLVRHGQLQLLLNQGKRTCDTQRDKHSALAVALIRYLQVHYPLDLETLG